MSLYWYILLNANKMDEDQLDKMLDELERQCMARHIQNKFNDLRPIPSIVTLITEEYGSAGLYPKTCT